MTIKHKLVLTAISGGAPLILWAALSLIAGYSAVDMRRLLPWIRILRRVTSWTTLALFLLGVAGFPLAYAEMSLLFSSVVILIDLWAFKRFAPLKST